MAEVEFLRVAPAPVGALSVVVPFGGQAGAVDRALRGADLPGLPEIGAWQAHGPNRAYWFAAGQWLFSGPDPAELAARLSGRALVAEQSDAWAGWYLTGPGLHPVLARATPFDAAGETFAAGSVARTPVCEVPALVAAGADGVTVLWPRSYAAWAKGRLDAALRSAAAQNRMAWNTGTDAPARTGDP